MVLVMLPDGIKRVANRKQKETKEVQNPDGTAPPLSLGQELLKT